MSGRTLATAAAALVGVALVVSATSEAQLSGAPPPTPFPPVVQTQGTTAITGSVILAIPDGGVYVNLGPATVPVAGDVNVLSAPRLEATVSTAPSTWLAVAGDSTGTVLRTETSGLAGAPVQTNVLGTPTVILGGSAMTLLAGQRNCAYTPLGNPSVGSTPVALPRSPSQTGITVSAHNFGPSVDYVLCWPETLDAGPLPNCANDGGVGYPIHSGGALDLDLTSTHRVFCRACAHGGGPAGQTADLGGGLTSCIP